MLSSAYHACRPFLSTAFRSLVRFPHNCVNLIWVECSVPYCDVCEVAEEKSSCLTGMGTAHQSLRCFVYAYTSRLDKLRKWQLVSRWQYIDVALFHRMSPRQKNPFICNGCCSRLYSLDAFKSYDMFNHSNLRLTIYHHRLGLNPY